jgi:hypothetical protein
MLQIVYSFVLSVITVVPKVKYIYVGTWAGEIFSTPSIGPWNCKPRTDRNVRFLQWPSPGYAPRLGRYQPCAGETAFVQCGAYPQTLASLLASLQEHFIATSCDLGLRCYLIWPKYICGVFYHWHQVITRLHRCGWYYRTENTASNSSSVVPCVLFAAGACLPNRCLETAVSSGPTIPAFMGGGGKTQTARWSHKRPLIFELRNVRLHNEEFHNLYSSPSITRMNMTKRVRWVGHVSRMGRGKMHIWYLWESKKERDN